MDSRLEAVAAHWSRQVHPGRTRWWTHPAILRHINRLVCGEPLDGGFAGFNQRIRERMPTGGFARAVSIGCGVGAKEIILLSQNIVQRFDLFEVSETRLEQAKRLAARYKVLDRIDFHCADAFEAPVEERFDLVHWNNALHHMFDVRKAIAWSHASLKRGGCFAMDDFVGASHFQWSDAELDMASRVRQLLPDDLLRDPNDANNLLDRRPVRPDLDAFIAIDPSEAADSANILDGVRSVFPDADVIPTGGVVYHLALSDALANFDDAVDAPLLEALLLLDESLAGQGLNHYAVAIATKA